MVAAAAAGAVVAVRQVIEIQSVSIPADPSCNLVRAPHGWFLAAVVLGCASVAFGADSEPTPRVDDQIVVTSGKQVQVLDRVPASVSVVSGEELRTLGIDRLDDASGLVPGLTVSKNDGAGRVVAIRGVGWETAQNLSTQPGVLLYVDGIYVVNPLAYGIDLDSIERVEVFRGPQGTEFGQSATGGAIHLVAESPRFDRTSVGLALGLGSEDRIDGSAAVNLAINDRLAMRISGRSLRHDGFSMIGGGALDGYALDDTDSRAGRLALEWEPATRWTVKLAGWTHSSDHHGTAQRHLDDPSPNPRVVSQDFPSRFGLDSRRATAHVQRIVGRSSLLQLLTGWQSLDKHQSVDGDRLTEDLVAIDLTGFGPANFDLLPVWDNDSNAFSQELAALGSTDRIDWVAGLYYLEHENNNFFTELIGPAPASQFADQIASPNPDNLPPFQIPLEFVEDRTVTRWDGAAYGQTSLKLRPHLELTVGARWQRDRSRDQTTQFWFIDSAQQVEDSELTWRLALNRAVNENHLMFVSLATGWRNGGLNPGALIGGALDVRPVFQPEEVTTLELGTRSSFDSHRGRLAATAFASDYRNYQYIQEDPVPFSAGTGNIGEVTILGVEAEGSLQLGPRWELSGQATWMRGRIDSTVASLDVVDFLNSGVGRFTDGAVQQRAALRTQLRGNTPPKLPEVTARLSLTNRQQRDASGLLTSRLDLVYRGEYQYRVFNHPQVDTVPGYAVATAAADYQPADSRWRFGLTVSNLFDRDGVNSRFTNPFGLHTTSDELIPPRQVVTRIGWRF